jgi:hypothetical protein
MEQEWYCTIIGVEFGPVSWDDVVQMVIDGQLSGDDTIRQGSTGEWRPAKEISGLFEQAEAALSEFTDLSELMVVSEAASSRPKARTAARPPSRPAPPPPPPIPDDWYFQSLGHVLGPCSYDRLIEMARSGELHPSDPIRPGADSEWQAAGTMPGLFPAHVLAAAAAQSAPPPAPVAARPAPAPVAAAPAPAPVQAPPAAPVYQPPSFTDREWYTWLLGREFGPLTLLELRDMLAMGKLSPHEPVRYGEHGQWVAAQTCDILFGPLPTPAPPAPVEPEYVPEPEPAPVPVVVVTNAPTQPGSTPEISVSAAQLAAAMPAAMDGNKELVRQLLELLKQEGGVAGYQATHSQNDAQWYCQIKGQEMGPLSIDVIAQMTVQKRILPTDLLRNGTSGDWFPASSVEQLFPSNKAKASSSNDEAMFGRLEKLFEESQTDAAARREQAAAAAAAGPKKTEASRSAAGSIIRNMNSNVLREAEAQKLRAKEKAASDSIGQQLKDHPREVAIIAVIAIAGLIYWFSPGLLMGFYAGGAFTKFESVYKDAKTAHNAGGSGWESKAKKYKEEVDAQLKKLKGAKRGTSSYEVMLFGKKVKGIIDMAGLPKSETDDKFEEEAKRVDDQLKKTKKKLGRK